MEKPIKAVKCKTMGNLRILRKEMLESALGYFWMTGMDGIVSFFWVSRLGLPVIWAKVPLVLVGAEAFHSLSRVLLATQVSISVPNM